MKNMKKLLFTMLVLVLCQFACVSKKETVIDKSVISQKLSDSKDIQLVLKSVVNDSRCPENVNCIWAGECEIQIAIYKNRKLISTENILLSPKLQTENITWFSKYYPNQKIKEIGVLPYPKSEVIVDPKDYFVKILFE